MSGMRNEPPISTSCPLETITSFPSAKELRANRTAEALLFTNRLACDPKIALDILDK